MLGGDLPIVAINQVLKQATDLGLILAPLDATVDDFTVTSASNYLNTPAQVLAAFTNAVGNHVEVPHGFAIVMDEPFLVPSWASCWFYGKSLVYNISDEKMVLVEIGEDDERTWYKKLRIGAKWTTISDWEDGDPDDGGETSIGVKVFQPVNSNIEIHTIVNCTVAVQNATHLGSQSSVFDFSGAGVINARIAVDLHSMAAGGYNNQNTYHNLTTHVNNGVNDGMSRYGYRTIRESGGSTSCNGNILSGRQLFELEGYDAAECAPFLILNGNGIGRALDIRSEGCPSAVAIFRNDAYGLEIFHGGSVAPRQIHCDFDDQPTLAHGLAKGFWDQCLNDRSTWESPIIPDVVCISQDGGGNDNISVPGMSVWHTSFDGAKHCWGSPSGVSIANGYLVLPDVLGLFVKVDTKRLKHLMVSYDRDPTVNNGGRPVVIGYDKDGTKLGGNALSITASIEGAADDSGLEFTSTAHLLQIGDVIKITDCSNAAYNWLQSGACTVAATGTGGSARVTTADTHYLQAGDWIELQQTVPFGVSDRYRVRAYVDSTHFDIDCSGMVVTSGFYRAKIRHIVTDIDTDTFQTHRTFNGTATAAGSYQNLSIVKGRSGETWSPFLNLFPNVSPAGKGYRSGGDGVTDRLVWVDDMVESIYVGAYRCAIRSMKITGLDPRYALSVSAGHKANQNDLYGMSEPTEGPLLTAGTGTRVHNALAAGSSAPQGWYKADDGWHEVPGVGV